MKHWNNHGIIMFCLVGVLVIGINPLGASAVEYFVATTGNNSNSGSIGSPFLTLEKAVSVMASGDTMFIRGGTYQRTAEVLDVPSGGGSWGTATIIGAYNEEQVIITPQNPVANITDIIQLPQGKSYIIFDGLILDGQQPGGPNGGRMGFRFADGTVGEVEAVNPSHHIRIIDTEMRYTYTNMILTTDAHHLEFINLNLHHSGNNDPNSTKKGPYGIYMSSGNNLIKNCDIHHHKGWGVHNYSAHTYKPDNNIYEGNRFYANGKSGIIVAKGSGSKLINNIFYGNGTGDISWTETARYGLEIGWGATGTVVYNNTFYGNSRGELLLTASSFNTIVKNNIFYGTNNSNYSIYIDPTSSGSIITNNLIYHDFNLSVKNLGSAMIANNILGQNPLLLNPKNADFHLQSGSPARETGIFLNEVEIDFDNVQRNQPLDIGAYAFVGSRVTTRPASVKNVQVY